MQEAVAESGPVDTCEMEEDKQECDLHTMHSVAFRMGGVGQWEITPQSLSECLVLLASRGAGGTRSDVTLRLTCVEWVRTGTESA